MGKKLFQQLIQPAQTKIVLLVMDGLGGLARQPGGKTELETAYTPNLDALAEQSVLGLTIPVDLAISAGSGPGHLALFGYDPLEHEIGRGALEALGVDFDLGPQDIAARGNFCTINENGILTDRRAGRLPTEESRQLAEQIRSIKLAGAEFFIEPVKEHRFAFIMRGRDLTPDLTDTDPLAVGVPPLAAQARNSQAVRTAELVNEFLCQVRHTLQGCQPANMILLRGFDRLPILPTFSDLYGLRAAAIAVNGMYRGVARLAGMEILPVVGLTPADELAALERYWPDFDYFYIHIKQTDTYGERGDFDGKVRAIEEVDKLIPRLMALKPDVIIVGGDHSTPAVLNAHSWHPVPVLLFSRIVRADGIAEFGEHACARGSLGVLPAKNLMPLALANAGRVMKYGA